MNKQKGFTIIELLIVMVLVVGLGIYGTNIYKLTQCDFKFSGEADGKCEIIHGLGLVGPLALGAVWAGTDEQ